MKSLLCTVLFSLTVQVALVAQDSSSYIFELSEEPETEWVAKSPSDLKMAQIDMREGMLDLVRNKEVTAFQIPLLDGEIYEVNIQRVIQQMENNWSVTGRIGGHLQNSFILSKNEKGIYASVHQVTHHSFYEIVYNADLQTYLLVQVDPHQKDELSCGIDHAVDPPDKQRYPDVSGPRLMLNEAEGPATIDVMIVYTTAAESWANDNVSGGIDNVVSQAMSRAQLTADNSLVDVTFRLVHAAKVDYLEAEPTTESFKDLNRLTASPVYNPWGADYAGYMDEVHYWREIYGADLVALFTLANDTGGIAWLPTGTNMNERLGFSLSRVQQAMGSTHTHEMGHNMGSAHSRNQNTAAAGPEGGRAEYSTGWRWTGNDSNGYASVMTYLDGDTGIDVFSNPDVNHEGAPTGSYDDLNEFAPADNARSLNEVRHIIASYRPEGGTDVPFITVSDKELTFEISSGEQVSKSIIVSNQGTQSLEYQTTQGVTFEFNEITSSGGSFQKLNTTPLSGTLSSIHGDFILDSQDGDTRALDLAVLVTETSELTTSEVLYQFGGWNNFAPSGNVTYWQHGYGSEPGTGVHSTELSNTSISSDNFYLWLGNARSSDTYTGTWTGKVNISGLVNDNVADLTILSGSGSLLPNTEQQVDIIVDANGLLPGTYKTNITVGSNDPINPAIVIPVTIEVTESEPGITVAYDKNWNMTGVPVESGPISYQNIFTQATGEPFIFNSAYQEATDLEPKFGYWIHLSDAETVNFSGNPLESVTLDLQEGWNLVSGLGFILPEESVVDNQGIINSSWYGFNGSYFTATDLDPGFGYWVRASQAGTITLDHSAGKVPDMQRNQPRVAYSPEESFHKLHFTAARDTLQTLFFGESLPDEVHSARFVMPPKPPLEAFDARFTVENSRLTTSASPGIKLQTGGQELSLHLESTNKLPGDQWQIQQMTGGRVVSEERLSNMEQVMIHSPDVDYLKIIAPEQYVAEPDEQPREYFLSQNYPNPFNPTTQISYQLPANEYVKMSVFDMTGRKVATLVNKEMPAGSHTITFDASNLSSGVYMYRLQAGAFQQVRRLTVIK